MTPPVLEQGPFTLRLPRAEDVSWIFHACQDADIQRFTMVPGARTARADAVDVRRRTADASAARPDGARDFVVALTETGELLGAASLELTARRRQAGELGYWVERDARRQGVARRRPSRRSSATARDELGMPELARLRDR